MYIHTLAQTGHNTGHGRSACYPASVSRNAQTLIPKLLQVTYKYASESYDVASVLSFPDCLHLATTVSEKAHAVGFGTNPGKKCTNRHWDPATSCCKTQ